MQDGYTQLQDKVLACCKLIYYTICLNRIGGVMVSMFTSSTVDRGFEPCSSQTKDYKIDICCFSAKHAELRRKSKDWLARNQDNVSEWSDISIRELLFQ
jgi:hypothetical protein